ncbi:hypothetical protein [Lapidilactobacillus wuchangensis]|uniref:hypothetical protein n=1 Tax=Lapidilactobacillus wuchangensis TaxID=2486001 RepID=UPI000F78D65C|nr:hypothetical protein [Lapidilactobacillus wuchangensis]
MTISYLTCKELTSVTPAAAWATTANSPAVVATNLTPLAAEILHGNDRDLLSAVLTTFQPDLTVEQAQEIAAASLEQVFSAKAQITVAETNSALKIAELYHQPTMTDRDLAASLYLNLFAWQQRENNDQTEPVFLASDPTLLISLAHFLPGKARLIGFFAPEQIQGFQRQQLAAALDKPQVKLYQLEAPITAKALEMTVNKQHFQELAAANQEQLIVLDNCQFSLLLGQIFSLMKVSLAAEGTTAIATSTYDFSNVLAAYYAQQLGAPISSVTVALKQMTPLARFFENGEPALTSVAAVNLQRLVVALTEKASTELNAAEIASQLASFLTVKVVDAEAALPEIRRAQSQQQITVGPDAALALAAIAENEPESLVLAAVDPYLTPDVVLAGITNHPTDKRDFDAAQILRQVIAAPMPRMITHLKSQEIQEFPVFSHAQIADELAAWLDQ